ncbi:dnaJ homolog subfamily C member 27-B-like [Convolutriloba macropyga]|uniref:dnaJ homolog subfamily C member 27-B-like n=1 Tax=Convolutriloba macropyga TaxID=536237 RepID=UPI003F520E5C
MDEKEFKTMFDKCNQEAKNLHWFKIVFVGDCYVGKTSIIKSFCKAQFNPKYTPTVGVDYGFKVMDGLRIHMWDLSGNPYFKDTRNELYENCDLCIMVYDVNSRKSFESLDSYWWPEIQKYDIADSMVACIGNKRDSEAKQTPDAVTLSDAEIWCLKKGSIRHQIISAATGDHVQMALSEFIKLRVNKINKKLPFV